MEVAQKDMMQIAASLAEFERVEAVGMRSATLPDKIDALLRELVRLRRKERASIAERDALHARLAEVERERDEARRLAKKLAAAGCGCNDCSAARAYEVEP